MIRISSSNTNLNSQQGNLMANQEVKVLGFCASPGCCRVEWALRLKGIEYEYIEEDIFNKSPLLMELNPVTSKVPVLVHKQKPIAESLVILEFLDEAWKDNPLLPRDPYQRATARFWAKFADEKLLSGTYRAMCSKGEDKENKLKEATDAMEKMEDQLKGKNFFGGESIGYLDIALGWICSWLPVFEEVGSMHILDSHKFPAITAWINNFSSHPVIKDKFPPKHKMVAYFEKRRGMASSMAK